MTIQTWKNIIFVQTIYLLMIIFVQIISNYITQFLEVFEVQMVFADR